MKFVRSGRLALLAGALCALLGLASAPAQALTMQQAADALTIFNPTPTTEFGISLVPTVQPVADLFDVTTYSNGRAVGLTFTLNQATDFAGLADPGLQFGISATSSGLPFVDHAAFFNGTPAIAAGGAFDLIGSVTDGLGNEISLTLLSADANGIGVELPFFGLIPFLVGTNQIFTLTIAAGAGVIDSLAFTMAFAVPEPGTLALIGFGLLGLALGRRRLGVAAPI